MYECNECGRDMGDVRAEGSTALCVSLEYVGYGFFTGVLPARDLEPESVRAYGVCGTRCAMRRLGREVRVVAKSHVPVDVGKHLAVEAA